MIEGILLILEPSTNNDNSLSLVDKLVGPGSRVTVLNIIDSDWKNILGDEWISNTATRKDFFQYVENNFYQEAVKTNETFNKWTKSKEISLNTLVKTGVPQKIILETFTEFGPFDMVILPSSKTKSFKAETLARKLGCPVVVNPV